VDALVIRAKRQPLPGLDYPGPHQIYRWPKLHVEERSLGSVPAGHLRVEMKLVGVCGTDLHTVKYDSTTGYILGTAPLDIGSDGRVLGHEGIGRVSEIGSGVEGFQLGNWVVFESLQTCHCCEACRKGRFNQCTSAVLVGMQRDGLFAEIADLPAQMAHNVSDLTTSEMGQQAAVCIEPAACSFVALSTARLQPGENVLIFGAGPIGFFAAMLSRLVFGAASIQIVEPLPFRREFVGRWAARVSGVEEFFTEPPWRHVDVIIEASGQLDNVDRALSQLRPNGRIVLIGRSGKPLTLQQVDNIITNNLSIIGSRGHLGGAFGDILRLYRDARIPLQEAVTGTVDGLVGLKSLLEDQEALIGKNCKLLARF
jgi:(R,R)-butanediol dehydrogenase / meso-butanediol dehydrogenase / diacetyl reductase